MENLSQTLIKNTILYIIVLICLILIVFFPRNADIAVSGRAATIEYGYKFSWKQYKENISNYVTNLVENKSLGYSRFERVTVEDEIKRYFPNSLKIIATAFLISLIFGLAKGIFDYRNRFKRKNLLGNGLTWLFQSIPDFFLVICIQWIIIFWIPSIKLFSQGNWYSFILPGLLVSIYPMMYISRITSLSISSQEGLPYIQVARSKGFSEERVLYKHILKNSLETILSHMSSLMIYILSNLLIVEYLIGYEGIAYRLFVAMGITKNITFGYHPMYESNLIVAIGVCLLITVISAQIIGFMIKKGLRLQ
ncbi:ABC transporter permease [Bacillus timonensis]|nr:ABC transporter permease [Bacillus timonensis]